MLQRRGDGVAERDQVLSPLPDATTESETFISHSASATVKRLYEYNDLFCTFFVLMKL